MREQFLSALNSNSAAFGLNIGGDAARRLADYYELVREHNPLLHLVGPSTPEEFASRHILESLMLLEHLPIGAGFADVGAGAGLPSIPCLLVRDDLKATLIEPKEKKSKFLSLVIDSLLLSERARLRSKQFSEVDLQGNQFVACRALDKFTERLPALKKWAMRRPLLLFGGPNLEEALKDQDLEYQKTLMPLSERRYLFVVTRHTPPVA